MSDQLNQWMRQHLADNAAKRAADQSREAGLLGYATAQRAKIANGAYTASADWTPPRTELSDFISREVMGVDLDAGTHQQEAYEEAWSRLSPAQQESVTAEEPEAQEAYAAAVAKVENERESAAYLAMSRNEQLRHAGLEPDPNFPD